MALERIYEHSNDLHIKNYVVYGKAADGKLYLESTFKTQVDQADIEDAFAKGMLLIDDDGVKLVPVSLEDNVVCTLGTATITQGDTSTTTAEVAVLTEWEAKATPVA